MKHSTLPSGPNSGNTHVVGNLSRPIKFRAWGRYGEWEEDENLDCRKWQMIDGDSLCFEEFKPVCDLLKTKMMLNTLCSLQVYMIRTVKKYMKVIF